MENYDSDLFISINVGGSGERLWPLSNPQNPKQLVEVSGKSLINITIDRFTNIFTDAKVLLVSNKNLVEVFKSSCKDSVSYITEPESKNTGPAIIYALKELSKINHQKVVIFSPSDNLIENECDFADKIKLAVMEAENNNQIVLLGTKISSPDTKYGYIKFKRTSGVTNKVLEFVEKPTVNQAQIMSQNGEYLWNSGIIVSKVNILLDECEKILNLRLDKNDFFSTLPKEPIEELILKKSINLNVINCDFGFIDTGTYLFFNRDVDRKNNHIEGNVTALKTTDSTVINRLKTPVCAFGVKDLIVVANEFGILITTKELAPDLKELTTAMNQSGETIIF